MSAWMIIYLLAGFVLAFILEPEDGRTLGHVLAMTIMWPLAVLVMLMRVRL